jgi:hypothetical protein
VAAIISKAPVPIDVRRDLPVQRGEQHPPRTLAYQLIQLRAELLRLALVSILDYLQHGGVSFPGLLSRDFV